MAQARTKPCFVVSTIIVCSAFRHSDEVFRELAGKDFITMTGLILDGWPGWFYVAQRTVAELLLSMRLLIEAKKLEDGR